MNTPIAYLRGELVPEEKATVAPTDTGFVLGATVSEQLRTFSGKVYRLDDHLDRFARSLAIVGLTERVSIDALREGLQRVVTHNYPLAVAEHGDNIDLGVTVFATPGIYAAYTRTGTSSAPTVCVHTFPLPFALWAERYAKGQSLVTTDVVQVPPRCWPRELKCRSRMHYYLADRQAAEREPGARALLLDEAGYVNELSTANVVAVFGKDQLVTPPEDDVLHGISMAEVKQLANAAGMSCSDRPIKLDELATADEILLTSTPYCLLPCCRLNGQPVGSGTPGPVFQQLLSAWNDEVGLDIAEQARRQSANAA